MFLSDEAAGAPRFRLTYAVVTPDTLSITFDIAPPGSPEMKTYVKGEVHRVRG